jgi:hypothetical protein
MIWFVVCSTLSGAAGKLPDGDTLHRTYMLLSNQSGIADRLMGDPL